MGNNPTSFTKGSVLIVDPNPPNNNLVSSEELNIIVELETINKPRSAINVISQDDIEIVSNNPNNLKVNFINGTDINGKKSLTTNYTELGTEYNQINNDLETFGITSIEIDFNSSYAPVVKINFTDIRGRLFELGNESPYNVFFSLPYPIFKLKVKGFYGKSVTYCLHLVNFNAEFDAKTGNFNIVGEFIGYTYALLSDMLLGYLKAIPETSFGEKIIQREGDNFLKLNELTQRVEEFNKEVGNLKQSDDNIQELAKNEDLKNRLLELRTIVNQGNENIIDGRGIKNSNGVLLIRKPVSDNERNIVADKVRILREIITKEINNFNNGTPDNLRLSDDNFIIKNYQDVSKTNFVDTVPTNISDSVKFLFNLENPNDDQLFTVYSIKDGLDSISDYITLIEKNVETIRKDVSFEIQTKIKEIFGFEPGIKNFIGILTDHVELLLDSIKDVALIAENNLPSRLNSVRDKSNFSDIRDNSQIFAFPEYTKKDDKTGVVQDAWLGNDFSSDIFPEIKLVEEILEGLLLSKKRDNELLENLVNNPISWYPINPLDTPLFNEQGNPWERINNGSVNDLIRLMIIRAFTFMSHSNTNLSNNEILAMAEIEANNAYESISNKIVKETLTVYGGSNNVNSITNLIINELLNQDKSLSGTTNQTISPFSNPVYKNNESLNNNDAVIERFSSSTGFFDVGDPDPSAYFQYIYISGDPNSDSASSTDNNLNRKYYLPLNGTYDGSNISNKTNQEKINLRNSETLFFGSYVGSNSENENSRDDDGATYVKFIDTSNFITNNITLPEYGNEIITNKNINRNKIINENSFNSDEDSIYAQFSGKFGTQEFLTYQSNEPIAGRNEIPIWLQFYDNLDGSLPNEKYFFSYRDNEENSIETKKSEFDIPLNSEGVAENATSRDLLSLTTKRFGNQKEILLDKVLQGFNLTTPFITFNTDSFNNTSLFGSYFYYLQNSEEAKAFLYLHSIPFNGMNSTDSIGNNKGLFKNDTVKGLFNKRAGFINTPYPWILFMGGLLWRESKTIDPIIFSTQENNIDYSLIFDYDFNDLEIPTTSQYITTFDGTRNTKSFSIKSRFTGDYVDLETIITKLPEQVKNEFINEFLRWVESSNGWLKIKEDAEIFKSDTTTTQIVDFWLNFNTTNTINNISNNILNDNFIENYNIIGKENSISNLEGITNKNAAINTLQNSSVRYLPFNFFLEIRDGSDLSKNISNFLVSQKVIVNTTWRIWADDDLDGFIIDDRIEEQSIPFRVTESKLGDYVKTFVQKFISLNENFRNNQDETDQLKRELFNTINNDDIKISIYKNIKSIYDKWVCGSDNGLFFCGNNRGNNGGDLIDSFKFIDRAFNDISNDFKINPIDLTNLIKTNYNQSFYDYVGTLLRDNNFDFIPLPTFIDYNDEEDIKDVFRTFTYSEDVTTAGPQFVCMYIGERSNRLDLTDSEFTNQGFNFCENDGSDGDIPIDYATSGTTPVVLVNYSSQNQSIFKDLKLNQKEFTETNESLWITDEISKRGSPTNRTGIGQNLYQIYLTRSYSCTVEAMGNAQIQPFMYFQLNNVPMFRGAYAIINVKHKIVPHNMTTSFKGVRIKKPRTALVKDDSIYVNLIGSLSDVNTSNINLEDSNLSRARAGETRNTSTRSDVTVINNENVTGIIIEE